MPNGAADQPYDCLVLGAGIAGVTAARNLQQKGFRVLLLEGADRIGGRMYSRRDFVRAPGASGSFIPVEAGAEYVHVRGRGVGLPMEPDRYKAFWAEIEKHGFRTSAFYKMGSLWAGEGPRNRTFFSAWKKTKTALEALFDGEVASMARLLFDLYEFDPSEEEDVSAKTFVESKPYVGRGRAIAEYTLTAHTPGFLDTLSIAGISGDGIPAQLLEEAEYRLEFDRPWPQNVCGYDTLPRTIAQEFVGLGGTLKISDDGQRNMKVTRVERSGAGIISVKTEGGETFAARTAVCTFSVGMLDPGTGRGDAIFGHLLTPPKRTALEVGKMGPITKFSLEFTERKWDEGAEDRGSWAGHMSVLSNPEGGARTFFSAFPDQQGGPHVLTALLMGTDHDMIKDKSDAEAIQHLLDVLQHVYDRQGPRWVPETVLVGKRDASGTFLPNYLRQDWAKDEFARGGNSYLKFVPQGERRIDVTQAREALKNPRDTLPLFWAGEATAPAYDPGYQPLSVHGAYISGVRVAEDVDHYIRVCERDADRFDAYYTEKYLRRPTPPDEPPGMDNG